MASRIVQSVTFASLLLLAVLSAPVARAGGPAEMKLYVFTSGSLTAAKGAFQAGASSDPITVPVGFYVVKHPRGVVLFDTGNNDKTITDPVGWWGPLAKGFGLKMTADDAIDVQLAKVGVKPADVKIVILGHMHLDHAGNMQKFPNATFLIQNDELTAAYWPDAHVGPFYIPGDFNEAKNYKIVRLSGDIDVFGDQSIVVVRAPSHTPGSQFAVVRLPKSGTYVLTSDACYLRENLDKGILSPGGATWSSRGTYEAYDKFRYLRDAEGASIFFAHDPEVFKATKKAPEYYE
jgi:glyoxylase-like metal-dependent hydrolase (beta-lactamase superfamily II)